MMHNSLLSLVRCFPGLKPAHAWLEEVVKSAKAAGPHAAVIHTGMTPNMKAYLKSEVRTTAMPSTEGATFERPHKALHNNLKQTLVA